MEMTNRNYYRKLLIRSVIRVFLCSISFFFVKLLMLQEQANQKSSFYFQISME